MGPIGDGRCSVIFFWGVAHLAVGGKPDLGHSRTLVSGADIRSGLRQLGNLAPVFNNSRDSNYPNPSSWQKPAISTIDPLCNMNCDRFSRSDVVVIEEITRLIGESNPIAPEGNSTLNDDS